MSFARPLRLFLSGYVLLLALGTILLSLPGATVNAPTSFFTAFFTATSAVCLVGLTLVDTATFFTPLGQGIILLLIQLGVLWYLFFAVRLFRQISDSGHLEDTKVGLLLRRVITVTLLVEGGAFLIIFYAWGDQEFSGVGPKLFVTVFHAVSAFANAGFSVLEDNLYTVQRAFVLHLVVLVTYGLGGLGIDTVYDLFAPPRLRQRLVHPETDWRRHTKVAVNASILLVGGGALLFYVLEQYNTLSELNLTEKLIASGFQAATARTAGFYTVDIALLTEATLWLLIVLMFIGGGAGSAAGGVKITTFYHLFARKIGGTPKSRGGLPLIARWVVGYALLVTVVGTLGLWTTNPDHSIISLLFEQVSAFSSVGLSYAVTSTLSPSGQGIILASMLLGRIGLLALVMVLREKQVV